MVQMVGHLVTMELNLGFYVKEMELRIGFHRILGMLIEEKI